MDTDDASISQSNRRPHASGMFLYLLPLFELILGAFFLGMLVSHIQQSDLEEQRHRTDVSYIYPEASSDLSRIDQLDEEAQGEYARYAKKNDVTSLQGPYDLKDGSQGIVARNPIFLEKHGRRIFWGFAIVIIRVPDIFSDSMRSLDFFGYQYRLLKSASPWDPTYVEFYRSEKALVDPVSHWFSLVRHNGSLVEVLGHGRIVDHSSYGRLFYVLIEDEAKQQKYYTL